MAQWVKTIALWAWWPDFDPQNPWKEKREKQLHKIVLCLNLYTLCAYVHKYTYVHTYIRIYIYTSHTPMIIKKIQWTYKKASLDKLSSICMRFQMWYGFIFESLCLSYNSRVLVVLVTLNNVISAGNFLTNCGLSHAPQAICQEQDDSDLGLLRPNFL